MNDARGALVVGVGSTVRGDDAFGRVVARRVRDLDGSGARVVECHQLTPELAPLVAGADRVVFVDAAFGVPPGRVCVRRVRASRDAAFTHALEPGALLALAEALYGRAPDAWAVTAGGARYDATAELSAAAGRAVPEAERRVRSLVRGVAHEP